ncbi:MAG: PIN domain-containing protein [Patescibacteria group bacterium]
MKVIIVDANIILRFLVRDHNSQFEKSSALFRKVSEDKVQIYISPLIISEVIWVLYKIYKINKSDITEQLSNLISNSNVIVEEKGIVLKSLKDFSEKNNISFPDAYIANTSIDNNMEIYSFDKSLLSTYSNLKIFQG